MRRDRPGALRVPCTGWACPLPRLPPAWTRPRPLSGRCVTVVGPVVVDGDLQCCSMKEEHARCLCFPANEPINSSDIPSLVFRPTVSPLMIPLVYCHINSFQRAASVGKPWPRKRKRRDGRASHHVELGGEWGVSPPVCATGVSLLARGCLSGATPRGQPWTPP